MRLPKQKNRLKTNEFCGGRFFKKSKATSEKRLMEMLYH
jgi:hypothetical protein